MLRPRELAYDLALFPVETPTLLPATHTNSYALGSREILLVEPSTPYEKEQHAWLEWARAIVREGKSITAIVLTHHHVDHIGGLEVFARELNLPVWAHHETAIRVGEKKVTRELHDGETISLDGKLGEEKWNVLHTPGHAPGHICLHNKQTRTLVVGDMVASVGTILIAPGDGDMKIYLEQLDRLAKLDASLALPAHGEPIENPSALLRKYIEHRLMRENKVFQAIVDHPNMTDVDLVPFAYADTPAHLYPIALLSLQAHLEKLAMENRVVAHGSRWLTAH
jgi:glyoxylase-like metal-dependent hydrolase (beta-lactamase superfamily II)